jgi:dihydrofolate synthase / folylpolyglutamate synthase
VTGCDPVEAALARIGRQHSKTIDLSLARIAARLSALGSPERHLPPVFHVAGTNGKGSTIAFLRAFLEAAGYRCHAFTSPHLIRVNESIRVSGHLIAEDALLVLLAEIEAVPGEPITSFEALTAAAFLAFSRAPADASLIEVGLGGRTDATNLIPVPVATAVTRISRDHQRFLGNTLAEIAAQKAGIFKPDCPAVVAEQPDSAVRDRLIGEATGVGAPLFLYGRDWQVTPLAGGFHYEGPGRTLDLPAPALPGPHQIMNAATALTMLDMSGGFQIDAEAVRRGLIGATWPGRLQRLDSGALCDLLPTGWALWLDGAHNDSGGDALSRQAAVWQAEDRMPLDLIFGVRADKNPTEILTPLLPFASRLRAVAIPGDTMSLGAEEAAKAAMAAGFTDTLTADSVAAAIDSLVDSRVPRRILICGSLYLAGAVLKENETTIV